MVWISRSQQGHRTRTHAHTPRDARDAYVRFVGGVGKGRGRADKEVGGAHEARAVLDADRRMAHLGDDVRPKLLKRICSGARGCV
jgi:hypothetical protein